jgi:hypothetical protein
MALHLAAASRAPYDGTVTNVPSLEPGMYLLASTTGFYLVADHQTGHQEGHRCGHLVRSLFRPKS